MTRLFASILIVPLLLLAGCSEEDDILPGQKDKIVSYLTNTHLPRLVVEADVEEGSEMHFYSMTGNTVYRYITNYYNPARPDRPEVTNTSKVSITFRAYVFNYANIVTEGNNVTMPFFTNDPLLQAALEDPVNGPGLTPGSWSFEPFEIDMSRSGIIKGLYGALLGCREQDIVEAYMTYNMAYGEDNFAVIPKESPIAYFFTVESVE